jgi:ABC-type transport system involved in multi-copper enzyme maturation permease subunit
MYLTFIKKELLSNILSLRYALVFFLFLFLTVTAIAIRTHMYEKQLADYQKIQPQNIVPLSHLTTQYDAHALGLTVERKPNPISIFVAGLENELTRSFNLTDWTEPKVGLRKLNNASFQYSLNLDMVLIINLICSLLAMLLIFDAITGEKENGTLKVLLAGPLPRDVIIIGKMAAGLMTVVIPLILSWIIALVYVMVIRKIGLSPDDFMRLAWIAGLSFLFITFFFAFGMMVSCWTSRSSTSLAVCLFFWIFFVLAAPNLVPMAIKHFSPIPPQSKITLQKQAVYDEITRTMWKPWREELAASGKYTKADDIEPMWNLVMSRTRAEHARQCEKIDRYFYALISNQIRLNQQISRISPSASYTYASTQLAGTGAHDFMRLLSDVDAYQRSYLEIQEELEQERLAKNLGDVPYDPKKWPVFSPGRIDFPKALNGCVADIALLVSETMVLFLFAFIGFMRYDPR